MITLRSESLLRTCQDTLEPEVPAARGRDAVRGAAGTHDAPAGMTTEAMAPAVAAVDDVRRNVGVNAYEKLRTVLAINRTLGSSLNIDLVLPKILDSLITVFPQTDRAYILFPNDDTGELQVRAEKRKDEGTMITSSLGPISQTIANRVLSCGEAILNADGLDDNQFPLSDSGLDFPIRSMMCAPLIGPMQKPLGIIYVDTNDPYERFHEDDLEVLLSLAATAGQAVEYARTHEAQLAQEREQLIADLQKALSKVKALSGLLPICASCKKIRDDSGYWNQIEKYFKEHSEADFSHGICPGCAAKLYPKYNKDDKVN